MVILKASHSHPLPFARGRNLTHLSTREDEIHRVRQALVFQESPPVRAASEVMRGAGGWSGRPSPSLVPVLTSIDPYLPPQCSG